MQQALPFKAWERATQATNIPGSSPPSNNPAGSRNPTAVMRRERMKKVVEENAVIVFGRRGCCMSHVVRRLLLVLGVNPAMYEVDEIDEASVVADLEKMGGGSGGGGGVSLPAVFIGGRWFGGLDRIMATHITGELTPVLRQAGALWL